MLPCLCFVFSIIFITHLQQSRHPLSKGEKVNYSRMILTSKAQEAMLKQLKKRLGSHLMKLFVIHCHKIFYVNSKCILSMVGQLHGCIVFVLTF